MGHGYSGSPRPRTSPGSEPVGYLLWHSQSLSLAGRQERRSEEQGKAGLAASVLPEALAGRGSLTEGMQTSWERQLDILSAQIRPGAIERTVDELNELWVLHGREPVPVRSEVLYVSGPISGHEATANTSFAVATELLRVKGYPIISPMELDQSAPYRELLRRDLPSV